MKKLIIVFILLLMMPVSVLAADKTKIVLDFGKIYNRDLISFEERYAIMYFREQNVLEFDSGCMYYDGKTILCSKEDNPSIWILNDDVGSADNFTYSIDGNICDINSSGLCAATLNNVKTIEVKFDGKPEKIDTLYFPLYDLNKLVSAPGYEYYSAIFDLLEDEGKVSVVRGENETIVKNANGKEILSITSGDLITVLPEATIDDNVVIDIPSEYQEESGFKSIRLDFVEEPTDMLVRIKRIELDSSNATVNNYSSNGKLNISSDISLKYVGDYVKYKITLVNNDNTDYKVSLGNIDNKYIDYRIDYTNSEQVIKANSESVIYLTIKYNKQIPEELFTNGEFVEKKDIQLNLFTGNDDTPTKKTNNILKNPKTFGTIFMIILLIMTDILVIKLVGFKKTTVTIILLTIMLSMPLSVYALKTVNMTINSKVSVTYRLLDKFYINGEETNLAGGVNICADGDNRDMVIFNEDDGGFLIKIYNATGMRAEPQALLSIHGRKENNKVVIDNVNIGNGSEIEALKTVNDVNKIKEYLSNYYTEHGLPTCINHNADES